MGLDMFLSKMPKIKKFTFNEQIGIEKMIQDETEENLMKKYKNNKDFNKFIYNYGEHYHYFSMQTNIASWRKANHIHNWFVKNVQNGEDDCECYQVSKEQLLQLKKLCNKLIKKIKLTPGLIWTGTTYTRDSVTKNFEHGKVIKNYKLCERILPRKDGFFFGSISYTKDYLEDLRDTVQIINKALKIVDFESEYLIYRSSW